MEFMNTLLRNYRNKREGLQNELKKERDKTKQFIDSLQHDPDYTEEYKRKEENRLKNKLEEKRREIVGRLNQLTEEYRAMIQKEALGVGHSDYSHYSQTLAAAEGLQSQEAAIRRIEQLQAVGDKVGALAVAQAAAGKGYGKAQQRFNELNPDRAEKLAILEQFRLDYDPSRQDVAAKFAERLQFSRTEAPENLEG